jgi:DNA polymerase-1
MAGPLLIADVPWLLYRSYFALPKSIADGEGRPVNALLGTVNALLALTSEAPPPSGVPRAIVACMGAEQARYRVELYPPYHAHRPPMEPELAAQWKQAPALLEAMGWCVPGSDELEADDVMYSYALAESAGGGRALLLTADRDLYGAVAERVVVLELRKGGASGEIDAAEVRRRYRVTPEQVPDFIALRGDPSDGIPGAPGIGEKTAAELLREHATLEALLAAAHAPVPKLRPRLVGTLLEHEHMLLAFKRIATLQQIEVSRPADHITDHARGAHAARALGMRRLAERLEKLSGA